MTRRRFSCFAYVFLLLFAQQVALAHAAWHAFEEAQQHRQHKGDASFQGDLCGLHGAFAQVLGGVQSDAPRLAAAPCAASDLAHHSGPAFVRPTQAPLSRGPPAIS